MKSFSVLASRAAAAAAAVGGCAAFAGAGYTAQADALSPTQFRPFMVQARKELSHDTTELTLAFPITRTWEPLGLTTASCLVVKADVDGKTVVRPYTPTSPENAQGHLKLVVKGYPDGQVSKYLYEAKVGQTVLMKGPFQKFEYQPNSHKYIGMIAGGSGITPMLQVLVKILENPRDHTEVRLIFANRSEEDVLLKAQLDAMAWKYPNFKVAYTVDAGSDTWTGYTGHVDAGMIRDVLPPPTEGTKILVCGPPPMMKAISGAKGPKGAQGEVGGVLADMGYTSDHVFKF